MKFKVHLQRYVEELTTIVVDAPNIEEAIKRAEEEINNPDLLWAEGDDIIPGAAAHAGQAAFAAEGVDNDRTWDR